MTTTKKTHTPKTTQAPAADKITAYPFVSKNEIAERLAHDDQYVSECLTVLVTRTATRPAGAKSHGFQSSHAKLGLSLNECLTGWTTEQLTQARKLTLSYTKQLAKVSRQEAIAQNPELARAADVFSAR